MLPKVKVMITKSMTTI